MSETLHPYDSLEMPSTRVSGAHDVTVIEEDGMMIDDDEIMYLDDGSRTIGGGNREMECDRCGKWISLGRAKTGRKSLDHHQSGSKCITDPTIASINGIVTAPSDNMDIFEATSSNTDLLLSTPEYHRRLPLATSYSPLSPLNYALGASSAS